MANSGRARASGQWGATGALLLGCFSSCGSPVAPMADAAIPSIDAGPATDAVQPPRGELTCTSPGSFNGSNWSGRCGTQPRWPIMTGADPDVARVSLVPVETTIAQLGALQ